MADLPGTWVVEPISVPTTLDQFPSHHSNQGEGGLHSVATLVDRDAIFATRRLAGMLCYVAADDKTYKLQVDLTTWIEFASGAGGGGTTYLASFGDASPAMIYDMPSALALHGIDVEVTELWDGTGASIQIGTLSVPDKYFDSTETDLTELATFSKDFSELGPVQLYVTISPGTGPSTGKVRIQVSTTTAGT